MNRLAILFGACLVGCGEANEPAAGDWAEVFSIGALETPEEEVFGDVRDVTLDAAGRVYVLDGQAKEVRVFETDGSFLARSGGAGEGPGEFREPFDLEWSAEGELLVFDPANQRVTRLAGETLEYLGGWRTDLRGWEFCVDGAQLVGLEVRDGFRVHRFVLEDGELSSVSSVSPPTSTHPLMADYEIMAKSDCLESGDGIVLGSELNLTVEFVARDGSSSSVEMPQGLEGIVIEPTESGGVRLRMREDGPGYFHRISGVFEDETGALVSIHRESQEGLDPAGDVWLVGVAQSPRRVGRIPFVPKDRDGDLFVGVVNDPFPRVVAGRLPAH